MTESQQVVLFILAEKREDMSGVCVCLNQLLLLC